jgi:hypothetical protein
LQEESGRSHGISGLVGALQGHQAGEKQVIAGLPFFFRIADEFESVVLFSFGAGRLGQHGEDLGVLSYFEGEAYRLRRGGGDAARAAEAYARAITYPDAPPEAFREHGASLVRAGDRAGAIAAFETYLTRAPAAEDRLLIEDDIATLRAQGETP